MEINKLKLEKLAQHNIYRNFLVVMMLLLVLGGVMGVVLFFQTGNILNTIFGAVYVIICIWAMTSENIKSKMLRGD